MTVFCGLMRYRRVALIYLIIVNGLLTATSEAFPQDSSLASRDSVQVHSVVNGRNWYSVEPVSRITYRTYYFSNNGYPSDRYTLNNSDGDYLLPGVVPFVAIEGKGELLSRFLLSYEVVGGTTAGAELKEVSLRYKTDDISFEVGRGSEWLGHGYHGSLLLSNNAEPFPLIKFQTEKPFKIPYLGQFTYMIFNGWPEDFKFLAHRLTYLPASWIEIGATQTVGYTHNYKIWEFPKVISASEENQPGQFDNDQRASLDLAVNMPFLRNVLPPLVNGKAYFEYAGEDIKAWWQVEDRVWVGPLGFEFFDTAHLLGLWLATEKDELRVEYAQNYKIYDLFHNVHVGKSYQLYTKKWYRKIPFINQGAFMGHHMGPEADDLYLGVKHRWGKNTLNVFVDYERHGLASGRGSVYAESDSPECLNQYGVEFSTSVNAFTVSYSLLFNNYKNVDLYPDLMTVISPSGSTAQEYIAGLTISYSFYR